MFSLIITIISIALVAALALATLYYGGNAFNKGSTEAKVAKIINQAQQIEGALTLHKTELTTPPTAASLLSNQYLKTIPAVEGGLGKWVELWPGRGAFWAKESVDQETCLAFNKKYINLDGIPVRPLEGARGTCFGSGGPTAKYNIIINGKADNVLLALQSADDKGSDAENQDMGAPLLPLVNTSLIAAGDWVKLPSSVSEASLEKLLFSMGYGDETMAPLGAYRNVVSFLALNSSIKGSTYEKTFIYRGPSNWDRASLVVNAAGFYRKDSSMDIGTFPVSFVHVSGDTYKLTMNVPADARAYINDLGNQELQIGLNLDLNNSHNPECDSYASWDATTTTSVARISQLSCD